MKNVRIEDLTPQGAEFTLKQTGRTYRLMPVSVSDEIWMKQTFGDTLQSVFSEVRIRDICRIVFRILDKESKAEFAIRDVVIMDESGAELKMKLGGVELLMTLISGIAEQVEILKALLQTIGISRPMIDEFEADAQKKSQADPSIGGQSLTSYPPNTDGQPSTALVEQPEKSTPDFGGSTKGHQ